MKSTQAIRDRIRELMTEPMDDYDRAVGCVVDDLEMALKALSGRAFSMMTEIDQADEAACKMDGMFRDIFNQQERRDLIYVIITASDAYRAAQKRKNCQHLRKIGGGSIGDSGSSNYWHCQDCGESYDSRAVVGQVRTP